LGWPSFRGRRPEPARRALGHRPGARHRPCCAVALRPVPTAAAAASGRPEDQGLWPTSRRAVGPSGRHTSSPRCCSAPSAGCPALFPIRSLGPSRSQPEVPPCATGSDCDRDGEPVRPDDPGVGVICVPRGPRG
jgi:hypothetical protein